MRTVRRCFVDTSQGQVHVRFSPGEGEPLVLLHASPGSAAMLLPLIRSLRTTRPLYALDTLGNGDSDPPLADNPDIAYFASAAREAVDALGINRCALYGTHTGAHLATELAVTEPHRYSKLVIDGMGLYSRAESTDFEDRYTPVVRPSPDGAQLWWAWHFVRNGYLFFPWFDERSANRTTATLPPSDFLHAKVVEVLKALDTYRFSYRAAFRYPKKEMLAQLRLPTLVTLGVQDVLRPYYDELVSAVPGATGALIESDDFDGHVAGLARQIDFFLDPDSDT